MARGLRRITAEPIFHFTLLGALVFAAHHGLAPALDVPTIEVSTAKQRELVELFEQRQQRAPDAAERQQLFRRYVEDEALFSEGLRLSLVHTDPVLRGQLIARVRGMLQAELDQTPPTDAELRAYHDAQRLDYVNPETISYREYAIPNGPNALAEARRTVSLLQQDPEQAAQDLPPPNDHSSYSEAQLASLYGAELARKLWALPSGSWHALRSSHGIHVVRIGGRSAPSEPSFETLRERLRADYRKVRTARAFQAELSRLTSEWRVKIVQGP